MRIGFGMDVHPLVEGRSLILGGMKIPFKKGLLGHSDADVLLHATADAIIGAMGEGDIGIHFPDTDPSLKGISSLKILEKVKEMMKRNGYKLINLDATIVAERPKLNPYFSQMIKNIANVLDVPEKVINLKAKRTEGLGYIGSGEGMVAYAVVLLDEAKNGFKINATI